MKIFECWPLTRIQEVDSTDSTNQNVLIQIAGQNINTYNLLLCISGVSRTSPIMCGAKSFVSIVRSRLLIAQKFWDKQEQFEGVKQDLGTSCHRMQQWGISKKSKYFCLLYQLQKNTHSATTSFPTNRLYFFYINGKDTSNCLEKVMKISHFNQTNQRFLSILL